MDIGRLWDRRSVRAYALLATLGSQGAAAQPAPVPIVLDREVEGTLDAADPMTGDSRYQSYRVALALGQTVEIEMKSARFDAYVDVIPPGLDEPLLSDDDSGGMLNARLEFQAPAPGDYIIRAQALNGAVGPYTLTARTPRPPVEPPDPTPIASDRATSGVLDDADPKREDGSYYDRYRFAAAAGDRFRIDLIRADAGFDPRLTVQLENGDPELVAMDDDSGEGSDARLVLVVPASGNYIISAEGWGGTAGAYQLHLQPLPTHTRTPVPGTLSLGQPATGRLALDDANVLIETDESGAASYFYQLYRFDGRGGEPVVIDLFTDNKFDPVLEAGVLSPIGFAVARTNDDFKGSLTRSQLRLTPDASGPILIRARSLRPEIEGDGSYTLTVSSAAGSE